MAAVLTETLPAEPEAAHRARPAVIQGGMGVAVSGWRLAREVSRAGHLGVVSGTAMDAVIARRLQDGDPGGHYRRALEHFPRRAMAQRVLDTYFVEGGRSAGHPVQADAQADPAHRRTPARSSAVVGNFAEVWLAKEGHDGVVGINCLEKIQMATPTAILGAMLAGVDYVLMGAGIPREVPQLLRALAAGEVGRIPVDVAGGTRAALRAGRPARPARRRPAAADPARLPRDRLARPARVLPAPRPRDPPRRLRRRAPSGRRPLRAAAREDAARRARRAGLRRRATRPTWRRWRPSACRSGWPAPTARPSRWPPRCEAGAVGVQVGTLFALCARVRAHRRRARPGARPAARR